MFIYHFNRLIRNRVIWLIFAVLVAFAFVSVDSCVSGGGGRQKVAGRLGGKPVPTADLERAEAFVRGVGRNRNNDMPPALVETQAWQHLAALQTAAKLGLSSSPREVKDSIREIPSFSVQGRFDADRYQAILSQSLGITPAAYERLMADQLAFFKVASVVGTASWVSPMELEDEIAAWTDELTVQYAFASNRYADAKIDLPESELRSFYDTHRETFALPDRVAVHYAALSVSNYLGSVSIPDEDVEEYYDNNANLYSHTTTNDTIETRPLAAVRDEIVAQLKLDEARYAASTGATAFAESLGQADLKEFTWRSKARRMTVASTPLFGASDPLPQIDAAAVTDFRDTAFDLDPARIDARVAVVKGDNWVYILSAWTNSPAHTPDFESVRAQVAPMALANARTKAFESRMADLRTAVAAALKEGKTFAAAAADKAMNVSTSFTFSAHAADRAALPYSYALMPAAMRLRKGELSEPAPVADGALLVYLANREPGDPLATEMAKSQIQSGLARRRTSPVVSEWTKWNLKRLSFTSANPMTAVTDAGDAAGEE